MTDNEDPIWAAVLAAEDEYGEEAEPHARRQALLATAAGDISQAAVWDAVAQNLHILHSINRTWARPRDDPSARPAGDRNGHAV